mgnify:CR=1 FL=1
MTKVLVVAPHPDDETLGCAGTLLRHRFADDEIHWLIVTAMQEQHSFTRESVRARDLEISEVDSAFGFKSVTRLDHPTARLDQVGLATLIQQIQETLERVSPNILYLPFPGDAHSDHRIVFNAAAACTKWFRNPSIDRTLAYETPSETDFSVHPTNAVFRPTVFIDISPYLETKIQIMRLYATEMGVFPFPRSDENIRSLAMHRGAQSGFRAAEAFALIKEKL